MQMGLFRMAWRNIGRNRRRTGVTVAAMTLALFVMVVYTGLMQGMLGDMERSILETEIGDLQVHSEGYLDDPSIYAVIEEPYALIEELEGAGFRASPRLVGGGLVAARESSAGASLRGIDVARDQTVSDIHTRVAAGEWLDPSEPRGVVVGRRLARSLDITVGDELIALSQASDGSMANDLFTVRGILGPISDVTDRTGVFMPAETFREFFVLERGVHQIVVRRPSEVDLESASVELMELTPGLDTRSWRQLLPTLATMLDSARIALQMVSFIVYIVIAILILNAMLMAVFERIREFGLLKALGVGPGRVIALIFTESCMQTGLALAIGLTLSAPTLWYLSNRGIDLGSFAGTSMLGLSMAAVWKAAVSPATFAGPAFTLVAIVLVAVVYPAVKAARISPVEAMRHQ
jgi:ABC-type lipoprotein release transport system permease subunit